MRGAPIFSGLLAAAAAVLVAPLHAEVGAAAPEAVPLEVAGPQGPLAGTLLRPAAAQAAAALILPGSGPTDRDGNNPAGVKAGPYRLLAEGLAARGIATLRIDKRGMFGSEAAVADANAVTIPDYVADTAAWAAALRAATGVPCVWLIGHSEGGLIALAAAREVEGLCGLVLVAAPGRPLGDVIKAQLRANPFNAPLLPAAEAAIDALAAGNPVDPASLPAPLLPLFRPAVQGFLIGAFALDPARLAAEVRLPLLIVQGGKDIQVPVTDAERLKAAKAGAVLAVLPDANHVLKDVAGESRADNLATYQSPDLPLGQGVVATIAGFIQP
jgi:pimeloyl-ACP methyl ester carboxylesterase